MKSSSLLAIVLVVIGIGSLLGAFVYEGYILRSYNQQAALQQQYPSGMMSGYVTGYGGMMGQGTGAVSLGQPITIEQAIQTMRNVPSYAEVIPSNNTIVFESRQFTVFVVAIMPDRAVNLTGRQPPNYATDDVFVIMV